MEIENANQEEDELVQRFAILNRCLTANEQVEFKQIPIKIKQIIEDNTSDNTKRTIQKEPRQAEIYLTNYRVLIIQYHNNQTYEEKSIFFQDIKGFEIVDPKAIQLKGMQIIQYSTIENSQIEISIFVDRLQNQDSKLVNDYVGKKKGMEPIIPLETVVKKQILERDQKLNNFYQLVVINKKALTEEQFWSNHEEYQNFLKYKERDEEKIKRDYIEKEIPLINKEFKPELNLEVQDERTHRFDKFREIIYDPDNLIETQNLKSVQSYKQDVYFYGKIDDVIQKHENQKKIANSANKDEDVKIDDSHHHNIHHLEIEEHSLETTKNDTKKNQSQEMKKDEYQMKLKQNAELEKDEKLKAFVKQNFQSVQKAKQTMKEFKEGDLKNIDPSAADFKEQSKDALSKVAKRVQIAWKQAFEGLYKLKPLPQNIANTAIAKKSNEIYYEKFYQLREILRWLYKEKNNGDKARSEVIEKLKSELEQIKNSLNEILKTLNEGEKKDTGDDATKKVYAQQKERLQDLLDAFIFKQSNL